MNHAMPTINRRPEVTESTAPPPTSLSETTHGRPSHRYIGSIVYGGLDGIITTFAVVSGVAGAALGASVVLILGLANLLADGLSMAVGAYLAFRSEQEYIERERQRESWQIQHRPEAEQAILSGIYRAEGYAEADAERLTTTVARNPRRWVQTMLVEELGILADDRNPTTIALVTFGSFVLAGVVPLLVYLLGLFVPIAPATAFGVALVLSAAALFALGAAKVLVTERSWWRSGLQMLLVGGLAAAVAYLVGSVMQQVAA